MRNKKILKIMLVVAVALAFVSFSAEARTKQSSTNSPTKLTKPLNIPTDAKYLTINSIKMPIENDAIFGQNPYTGRSGGEWPQGSGNMYIFGAGIWVGAQIPIGGGNLKKVVSYGYNPNDGYSEYGPGIIVAPDIADHGVECPDPVDCWPVILSTEVGSWSAKEDSLWPVRDTLGNPVFVSAEDSWCFYNDADLTYHDDFASPGDQLNILVKQTTYAFGSKLDKDIIFFVWDVYNQGDDDLDSVYIGITVDPDLGNATDDMIGFDSTRNLCWVWNYNLLSDQDIQGVPGFMGFRFFESPLDTAGNQLGLTSLTLFTIDTDPANDEERYNVMAGRTTSGGPREPFMVDTSPQDKRFCQSTGPFNLPAGDSARVVFGVVAGQSENLLKVNSDYAQTLYDADFVAPIPPDPPVVTAIPGDRQVTLYWGDISESSYEPFAANDTNLREYDFEGYRIYRSRTGIEGDFEVLAEFDLANGITNDVEEDIDPEYGTPIVVTVHLGDDSGIRRYFVDTDALNGETYYYAVVAYDYQPKRPKSLESGKRASMVEVVAGTNPAGYIAPYVAADTEVIHTSSTYLSEGAVTVQVIDPTLITGHDYQVTFNLDLTWNLIDLDTGDTVLANQTNQSGDDTYPIVDGMLVKVIGPPAGIRDYAWTGARWLSGVDWGGAFFFGGLDIGYNFWGGTITDLSTDFVDVEIRFSPTTTQYAYSYLRGGTPNYGYQGYFDCPFTIWDVTSDPERQLNAAFVEWTGSNSYDSTWMPDSTDVDLGGREYLFILNSTYSPTPDTFYTNRNLNTNGDDFDILYAVWPRIRPGHSPSELADGQIFHIIATKPNSPNDVFTFSTGNASISTTQAKVDMDKIKVVPNPYFVRNILDVDPNVSHLMLTHLPERCTIRLYTLAGNLIQIIEHTSGTGQEIWNALTRNDQIPASGVYIFHVSSEFGEKVGRFAVIR